MRPEATPPSGQVTAMPTPRLNEKRWSIDLEKRIQEEHYSDPDAYNARYAFDAQSEREPFVIDTRRLTPQARGTSVLSRNTP